MDIRTHSSLIYGNPERFPGPTAYIDDYGGKSIETKAVTLPLGIRRLAPCSYKVYVSLVLEYILGVDVLQGLNLQTCAGKFYLQIKW